MTTEPTTQPDVAEGGAAWESGRAAAALADALAAGDPDAIRKAGSDLAASAGTAAASKMSEMAVKVLIGMQCLEQRIDGDIARRATETDRRDKQFERLFAELDDLSEAVKDGAARLGKLEAGHTTVIGRLDRKRAELDGVHAQIADLYRQVDHLAARVDQLTGDGRG